MKAITYYLKSLNGFIYTFKQKYLRPGIIHNVIPLRKKAMKAKLKRSIQFCEETVSKPVKSQLFTKTLIITDCAFSQFHKHDMHFDLYVPIM